MKCTMIVAAAAATSPMAMADLVSCSTATAAWGMDATCTTAADTCPTAYQGLVDTVYKECGGVDEMAAQMAAVKTAAAICKCSGAEMAAPVLLAPPAAAVDIIESAFASLDCSGDAYRIRTIGVGQTLLGRLPVKRPQRFPSYIEFVCFMGVQGV